MKAKEQFALVLRVIAVLGLIYLARSVLRNASPNAMFLITRLVAAVIGLYLLRGAPLLVRFAYPEEPAEAVSAPVQKAAA